jgi:flagellar protein FliJ
MKFKFSLESVLRVREHKEKLQKQKLAEKLRMKQMILDKKSEIATGLNEFLNNQEMDKGKVHDIRKLRSSYAHLEQSHQIIGRLDREMARADRDVSKERDKLAEAHRETHMLEKVKDREQKAFRKEEERRERSQMDEIAAQFHNR